MIKNRLTIDGLSMAIIYALLSLKLMTAVMGVNADLEVSSEGLYLIDIAIIFLCILNMKSVHADFKFINTYFILSLPFFVASSYLYGDGVTESIKSHLKIYSPLLLLSFIASYHLDRRNQLRNFSLYLIVLIAFLALVGISILPNSINRIDEGFSDGLWWPTYFVNIHTTAYLIVSCFFICFALWRVGVVNKITMLAVLIVCLYSVAYGWGIRTAAMSILILWVWLLVPIILPQISIRIAAIGFGLIALVIYYFIFFDVNEVDRLSSGRISMYFAKIDQLMNNTLLNWMIGNGVGSDLIYTDVWWWAPKGAHSDLITYLVEGGAIYLTIFLMMFRKLFKLFNTLESRAILISILFTSTVSNGFFSRPLALYIAVMSLSILYLSIRGGRLDK